MSCSDYLPEASPFINYCTGETKSSEDIRLEMQQAVQEERYEWAAECKKELDRRGYEYENN